MRRSTLMRLRRNQNKSVAVIFGVAVVSAAARPATAAPSVPEVLERAGEYVVNYERELGNVVGQERCIQEVYQTYKPGSHWRPRVRELRRRRLERSVLLAEYVLVRLEGIEERLGFRDVIEIDGKEVRDRQAKLARLFKDLPEDPDTRWKLLAMHSSQYNLGNIGRNTNTPTFALVILRPENRSRFAFEKVREGKVHGVRAWVLAFSEVESPTLIVNQFGGDMPTTGEFWVDPITGRVLKTELNTDSHGTHVRMRVTYRRQKDLDLWVPEKMEEIYAGGGLRTECNSVYRNFRRFNVEMEIALQQSKRQ